MSNELQRIYKNARINAYFRLPDDLAREAQRTLIPAGKIECRRWADGRVMYRRIK